LPGYSESLGKALGFDAAAAKSLLADAGYPDGKDFPKVSFVIADSESNRLTAEFAKAQIKQNLGVDIDIEYLDDTAFKDRYRNGDFQLTFFSWFADYADPENWFPQQFGTEGGFNVYAYSNPDVDKLFEEASAELDNGKRLALYQEAHELIIEGDHAITPIYHPERNYLVKSNVKGLTTTALDAEPGDWFFAKLRIEAQA